MRRTAILGAVALAGVMSAAGLAGRQAERTLEVEQLEDNLFGGDTWRHTSGQRCC